MEKKAEEYIRTDSEDKHPGVAEFDVPAPTNVTFIEHENPFSLVNNAYGVIPHVAKLSPFAWVGCGDNIYVLECLGKGHIRIEPIPAGDECMFVVAH